MYSGVSDRMEHQNALFAGMLARDRIPHRFFEPSGGHNWALWRDEATQAYLAAAGRLHA
jgi:enterochelin esterase-like enzyme